MPIAGGKGMAALWNLFSLINIFFSSFKIVFLNIFIDVWCLYVYMHTCVKVRGQLEGFFPPWVLEIKLRPSGSGSKHL